jgi:hypothetical protein
MTCVTATFQKLPEPILPLARVRIGFFKPVFLSGAAGCE